MQLIPYDFIKEKRFDSTLFKDTGILNLRREIYLIDEINSYQSGNVILINYVEEKIKRGKRRTKSVYIFHMPCTTSLSHIFKDRYLYLLNSFVVS